MTDVAYVWIAAGGLVVALISLIVLIQQKASSERTRRDEHQQEYGKTTEILCGLDRQLITINGKMDASDLRLNDIYERVIRNEESVKQAHARIDEIRDKTYGYLNRKEDKV
jgi:predicted  nucleic acid-binding Zn-ribbon protein